MAFRFRKSVKIAPGIRVNISKSGVSTSVGGRGATVNLSKRGTRVTAGIPGTGLSASHLHKNKLKSPHRAPKSSIGDGKAAAITGLLIFGAMAYLADEVLRVVSVLICIACLVGLMFMFKRPRQTSVTESPPQTPLPETPKPSSTWQERVAAIESARAEETSKEPPLDQRVAENRAFADHLGEAAMARKKARQAEKSNDFDAAWSNYHDEKDHFMLHAAAKGLSVQDTLALDASVHEKLANLLRKEKRHNDAFIDIVYWVSAQRHRPIKRHHDKFRSYYNRAGPMNVPLEDAWSIVMTAPNLDLVRCRSMVQQWLKPPQQ